MQFQCSVWTNRGLRLASWPWFDQISHTDAPEVQTWLADTRHCPLTHKKRRTWFGRRGACHSGACRAQGDGLCAMRHLHYFYTCFLKSPLLTWFDDMWEHLIWWPVEDTRMISFADFGTSLNARDLSRRAAIWWASLWFLYLICHTLITRVFLLQWWKRRTFNASICS